MNAVPVPYDLPRMYLIKNRSLPIIDRKIIFLIPIVQKGSSTGYTREFGKRLYGTKEE
jgi:hypothetical protein